MLLHGCSNIKVKSASLRPETLVPCRSLPPPRVMRQLRAWQEWEKSARMGFQIDFREEAVTHRLGSSALEHVLQSLRGAVISNVTEPVYMLFRVLFRWETVIIT